MMHKNIMFFILYTEIYEDDDNNDSNIIAIKKLCQKYYFNAQQLRGLIYIWNAVQFRKKRRMSTGEEDRWSGTHTRNVDVYETLSWFSVFSTKNIYLFIIRNYFRKTNKSYASSKLFIKGTCDAGQLIGSLWPSCVERTLQQNRHT